MSGNTPLQHAFVGGLVLGSRRSRLGGSGASFSPASVRNVCVVDRRTATSAVLELPPRGTPVPPPRLLHPGGGMPWQHVNYDNDTCDSPWKTCATGCAPTVTQKPVQLVACGQLLGQKPVKDAWDGLMCEYEQMEPSALQIL